MMPLRDTIADQKYFDKWINWQKNRILEAKNHVATKPAKDPQYRAQYIFQIFLDHCELLIMRYSRGDDLGDIKAFIPEVVSALEWAYNEEIKVFDDEVMARRKQFKLNFDQYVECIWLVSIAICLNTDDDLLKRMLDIIGNEGQDALFDQLVAIRSPNRKIGEKLLYPRPYQPLYAAINAPADKQIAQVTKFLKNWYKQMKRAHWHNNHENLEWGNYSGYWCFEAAGVVKAFGMDDDSFCDMPYYPKDLAR